MAQDVGKNLKAIDTKELKLEYDLKCLDQKFDAIQKKYAFAKEHNLKARGPRLSLAKRSEPTSKADGAHFDAPMQPFGHKQRYPKSFLAPPAPAVLTGEVTMANLHSKDADAIQNE